MYQGIQLQWKVNRGRSEHSDPQNTVLASIDWPVTYCVMNPFDVLRGAAVALSASCSHDPDTALEHDPYGCYYLSPLESPRSPSGSERHIGIVPVKGIMGFAH